MASLVGHARVFVLGLAYATGVSIASRRHFIFDLDGTLTLAAHDFSAIKRALGLPQHSPILESLATLSEADRNERARRLDEIELDIAHRSKPAMGARELLGRLCDRGCSVGIVTRNTRDNARVTLAAAGLDAYVDGEHIVGRYEAPAKPAPDGIQVLLTRWAAAATDSVMIGDYRFDIEAGRAAGVYTVLVCEQPLPTWGRVGRSSRREPCRTLGTSWRRALSCSR